jgi:2-polyprenyl-6-methoxyphenol hydroxylase-like FAD-dependent oxidoreductase
MTEERIGSITKALVVGGGIGGMAAAISLAERGVTVELVDIDPNWRVYGAGITITGPTLRAYKRLGMIDAIKAEGAITNKTRLFRYDGTHMLDLDEPVIEEGLPATGGIMRPVLHRIMQTRVRELEISVRLGLSVSGLDILDNCTVVAFSDGSSGTYDLVVGADSVNSVWHSLTWDRPSRQDKVAGAFRFANRQGWKQANSSLDMQIRAVSLFARRTGSICGC